MFELKNIDGIKFPFPDYYMMCEVIILCEIVFLWEIAFLCEVAYLCKVAHYTLIKDISDQTAFGLPK